MLNIPLVQRKTAGIVATELKKVLGTELQIGRINLGLANRIIIEDVTVNDRTGREMIKVTRLSAKFDLLPMFNGKISISSVQLFGFNVHLEKETPEAELNFKFIIDAFSKNDTEKNQPDIDLRINSLLIRRGRVTYDILSEPETPDKFNPHHLHLNNFLATISVKALKNDSINAHVKRMSVSEYSGLELQKLSFKILGNDEHMTIDNFEISLPETNIVMDTLFLDYNGLESFTNFSNEIDVRFKMQPSTVVLKDIAPLLPVFRQFNDKIELEMEFNGNLNEFHCPYFRINAGNYLYFQSDIHIHEMTSLENALIYGKISQLYVSEIGTDFIFKNLTKDGTTPPFMKSMGNISFQGEISGYFNDLVTYGLLSTDIGSVHTDIKLSTDPLKNILHYSGALKTTDFGLGKLTGRTDILENISLNLDIEGDYEKESYPHVSAQGMIASFDYKNYQYQNIELNGEFKAGGFEGNVSLDDKNGKVIVNGNFNIAGEIPSFNLSAELKALRPYDLHLTDKYEDSEFSMILEADFTGNSIDNLIGEIHIDSTSFQSAEKNFFLPHISLSAIQLTHEKQLQLRSRFLDLTVTGNYSYNTLPLSVLKIMEKYLPALISTRGKELTGNNFSFDLNIYDTSLLTEVFNIPFTIYGHSTIKGFFNDHVERLRVEGYFPRFRYGNALFESGIFICENPGEQLKVIARGNSRMKQGAILNLSLEALAGEDQISASANWGNNTSATYSGKLMAVTKFMQTDSEKPLLKVDVDIQPTLAILNDTIWNIHPSHIRVDSGKISVDNFRISHEKQFLNINGIASKAIGDTIKVDLNDINLGYIFDIANLNGIDFNGKATGYLYTNQTLASPIMNTRLFVDQLYFNNGFLGDMNVDGAWDSEKLGIALQARIYEDTIAYTQVNGLISIGNKELDLRIEADKTNIEFLQKYMEVVASDVKGRATGNARLHGSFKNLNLEGSLLAEAAFKIDILNTTFSLADTVRLLPDQVAFNNITIYDAEENQGVVNGALYHTHLRDLQYSINANVNNMLVMNTTEDPDLPFYGTVYATGNAYIRGDAISGLNVDVAATANRNTNMVYITGESSSAASNQFIKFNDITPKRVIPELEEENMGFEQEEAITESDIRLNILVDATPDATIRIIMDPVAGDYISARGNGNIRIEFYNKGDVKMFGNYTISQGVYKFSLQEVIRKDFTIRNGSTIQFNGDPFNAIMDVTAAYTVNAVSLNDLSSDLSTQTNGQTTAKVDCVMKLSGILNQPTISLDIELPNENEVVQRAVLSYINTDEEKNMQILYLLGIGKFYTMDETGQSSNAMSSVLSSTLSGQLNNALSQIMDNNNWNVGTNLNTGSKGWTEVEFETILSGQLLNNRLLINGNFGYRDNPLSDTNFIGDFDIEYLLTQSGEIRLKAYNKTNDRYYAQKTLTTQGIGIGYRKEFDNWKDFFRIKRKKRARSESNSGIPATDIPESGESTE